MFGWLKGSGKTPAAQRQVRLAASACAFSTHRPSRPAPPLDGVEVDAGPCGARTNTDPPLDAIDAPSPVRSQALRDAAKLPKGTTTEARSPVKRRNTAPAFSREQCRRDRAMMSSSFRRRMTWQQSLCVAPVIQLPQSERLAK